MQLIRSGHSARTLSNRDDGTIDLTATDWRRMKFNAFGIIFGILRVALLITLLDWFGRRKDRRRNHLA